MRRMVFRRGRSFYLRLGRDLFFGGTSTHKNSNTTQNQQTYNQTFHCERSFLRAGTIPAIREAHRCALSSTGDASIVRWLQTRGISPPLPVREVQSKTHACSRSCVCSEEAVEREAPGEEGGVSGSPVGIFGSGLSLGNQTVFSLLEYHYRYCGSQKVCHRTSSCRLRP
jgi:hypothetical protein